MQSKVSCTQRRICYAISYSRLQMYLWKHTHTHTDIKQATTTTSPIPPSQQQVISLPHTSTSFCGVTSRGKARLVTLTTSASLCAWPGRDENTWKNCLWGGKLPGGMIISSSGYWFLHTTVSLFLIERQKGFTLSPGTLGLTLLQLSLRPTSFFLFLETDRRAHQVIQDPPVLV